MSETNGNEPGALNEPNLVEEIAVALESAQVGFRMTLIRLVDGVSTYSLQYDDGQYLEYCDDDTGMFDAQDRLYEHVGNKKREAQVNAILSVLRKRGLLTTQALEILERDGDLKPLR